MIVAVLSRQLIGSPASAGRLPPLTALKAFESAGRVLSFTLAAEELGVTPGAISRQIRGLEDYLGLQLFIRSGRDVSLTDVGHQYLVRLADAFAQIRTATAQITEVAPDAPLRVSTSITFTMRWLMPKLMAFHSQNASSKLQLTMNIAPVDFTREDLDATVKMGNEETPHAVVRKLFDVDLIPVCSPKLIERYGPIGGVQALNHHTLLHSTARPQGWGQWLEAAGAPDITGAHQLHFESSSLAYQAALEGVGFAIAQLPLVLQDLRAGNLIAPFPFTTPDGNIYNLIWPDRTPKNESFNAFRDWIMREAKLTCQDILTEKARLAERYIKWRAEAPD